MSHRVSAHIRVENPHSHSAVTPEINGVFSSVGEDISHLLTFYGATFAVREEMK